MSAVEDYVTVNGARFWSAHQGTGQAIVLLHGGPGLYDYFDDLASMIDDICIVYRYDQRGSGRSQHVPPYDVAMFVSDLDALRAYWGHERWIVAGHSWGAALALAYAVEHPQRVSALIYMDGTGVIRDWQDEYRVISDGRRTLAQRVRLADLVAIMKTGRELSPEEGREYCVLAWQPDFADRSRAEGYAKSFLRSYPPSYRVNEAINEDWKRIIAEPSYVERVHRIEAPTLVLHGALDPRPLRLAERLAASLPHAELAVIQDSGHSPWLEQPDATRLDLRAFLAGVTQQTATAH